MAGFKVDFSEAQEFGNVADGTYEVVVSRANEDATKNGAEFINFDYIIRNDINQQYKNSHIFHKIWKAKDTGKYNRGQVMNLAKAFGLQDGKEYQSFDDFLNDFEMHTAKIIVKNEKSNYNGKDYENLNVKKFGTTDFPQLQHQFKNKAESPTATNTNFEIDDDDLPF